MAALCGAVVPRRVVPERASAVPCMGGPLGHLTPAGSIVFVFPRTVKPAASVSLCRSSSYVVQVHVLLYLYIGGKVSERTLVYPTLIGYF